MTLQYTRICLKENYSYQLLEQGLIYWSKSRPAHYHAHLGLPDKGREIKELVVCRTFDHIVRHTH